MLYGISFAATTNTNTSTDYDPFHLPLGYNASSFDIDLSDTILNNGDSDFFYQLRDITGATWDSEVGGPQWFATVFENWYIYYNNYPNTNDRKIYRRTMGGEIEDVPFSVIGDILDGFNYVTAEEPEPYEAWRNYIYNNRYYDVYPDPLESLCIVIANGRTDLNVKFGNPYARHFPFWWNWTRTTKSKKTTNWEWWRRNYDWTDESYPTVEPVKYIYSPSDHAIYEQGTDGLYSKILNFNVISKDAISDDVERRKVISGDIVSAVAVSGDIDAAYVLSGQPERAEHFWSADLLGHYLLPFEFYDESIDRSNVISRAVLSRDNKVISGDIISDMFLSGDIVSRDNVIHNPDDIHYSWILTDNAGLLWGDNVVALESRDKIPGYYLISDYSEDMYAIKDFEEIFLLSGEIVPEEIVIYEKYEIRSLNNALLFSSSGDVETGIYDFYSGDITRYFESGDTVYDAFSDDVSYPLSEILLYRVSDDEVYDYNNNLIFTLESAGSDDKNTYICEPRTIGESIVVHGFDEDYTVRVTPIYQGDISSGQYLNTSISIAGDPFTYGSKLGYITFRQRASFLRGYENFREATPIPMVIANVSNGNAEDNPLIFDMLISDYSGNIIKRTKFNWNAQSNITKDLGTFFMMTPINSANDTPYKLETRITNRTGTRYELYRYNSGNGELNLTPAYWKYDLTDDVYGTLPMKFQLDQHSQIAPGLVTVYNQDMNYTNINMGSDQSASFRLYEHDSTNPKNLTLNYKRIAGMYTKEPLPRTRALPSEISDTEYTESDDLVTVQGFSMAFTDIVNDENNTYYEIENLTGKVPVMVDVRNANDAVTPYYTYINSTALDAFAISEDVDDVLKALVYDIESFDTEAPESEDVPEETPLPDEGEIQTDSIALRASELVFTYNNENTGKIALQPIAVRMKIPRKSQLLADIWDQLDAAEDPVALFNTFARYGTIWVRSSATREYDANLFTAINNKGSSIGANAADCVRAFIYDDYLYLDFIVIMADAVSKNTGKTAFIEIFKDDDVPYILIGDGLVDAHWNLSFYVSQTGDNPTPSATYETDATASGQNVNRNLLARGSGSGCNSGIFGLGLLVLVAIMKSKR